MSVANGNVFSIMWRNLGKRSGAAISTLIARFLNLAGVTLASCYRDSNNNWRIEGSARELQHGRKIRSACVAQIWAIN